MPGPDYYLNRMVDAFVGDGPRDLIRVEWPESFQVVQGFSERWGPAAILSIEDAGIFRDTQGLYIVVYDHYNWNGWKFSARHFATFRAAVAFMWTVRRALPLTPFVFDPRSAQADIVYENYSGSYACLQRLRIMVHPSLGSRV